MRFIKEAVIVCACISLVLVAGCSTTTPALKTSTVALPEGLRAEDGHTLQVNKETLERYKSALAAMKAGKDREAEAALRELSRTHPELPGLFTNLGIIHYKAGRYPEAEQVFRKAVEINPRNKIGYNYLGVIARMTGNFGEAEKAYKKALDVDANYANAALNLGILYDLYLDDGPRAVSYYEVYQRNASEDKQVDMWIKDIRQRLSSPVKTP